MRTSKEHERKALCSFRTTAALVLNGARQGGRGMDKIWKYKDLDVKENLKPGSKHFQYFFVVTEKGKKKCNYCVWIEDKALSRFDQSKGFDSIVSGKREDWKVWVKEKIEQGDFRNLALKYEEEGQVEIDLDAIPEKLTLD
jgi:hypothetical protein